MITLVPFSESEFDLFISWVHSKELLVTIAGTDFTFPLTHEQLQIYLEEENSYSFKVVNEPGGKIIGHAEIFLYSNDTCKFDKLIIGDTTSHGMGKGQALVKKLLEYSFITLGVKTVFLNVFDWNTSAIKCYEKCGFKISLDKQSNFTIGNQNWTALNMTINREDWTCL